MDRTSSTACYLAQRGAPLPRAWAFSSPTCSVFNSDHIWLEELIGQSSNQSSTSHASSLSGPGSSRSSSTGTSSLYSWSSGVTCYLHSSIKRQSQEAFKTRLRQDKRCGKLPAPSRPHGGHRPEVEQGGGSCYTKLPAWPERGGLCQGRGSASIHTSAESVKLQWLLEEKIEAKLKFSQFLDEVTSNVLDPNSLQAFGKPPPPPGFATTNPDQPEDQIQPESPRLARSMAQQQTTLLKQKTPDEQTSPEPTQKTYLETDIDAVRREVEPQDLKIKTETAAQLEQNVIPPPPQFCQGFEMKSLFPAFHCDFPRAPYRSASLPKGINMVSDESRPSL